MAQISRIVEESRQAMTELTALSAELDDYTHRLRAELDRLRRILDAHDGGDE